MAKAKWTVTPGRPVVDAAGTARLTAVLADNGARVAELSFEVTADRALLVMVRTVDGAVPLSDFRAWSV